MSKAEASGLDLSKIRYVKRIALGGKDLNNPITEQDREKQIALLNKCLTGVPPGLIISLEVSTQIYKLGTPPSEHHISMQMLTYHVGFDRRPIWLETLEKKEAEEKKGALGQPQF